MKSAWSVVMVSASFHPYVGGAEKQALELSVALRRRGHEVVVLTRGLLGLARRETVRGVPVVRLPAWGRGLANAVSFMVSLLIYLLTRARSADAIHVHLAGSPALAALAAGRLLGKRVIIKLGGGRGVGELSGSAGTWSGRLKLRLLSWLKPRFVAVSRDQADELKAYGIHGADLSFLPNGVDTDLYRPASSPQEKIRLRAHWGWPAGLCFLYVGRLSSEKRLGPFLEAWSALPQSSGKGSFVALIGTGPEDEALKRQAREHAPGSVLILPPTDQIHLAYAAADVFILPSISEGLSNALLEAMSSGLAVLASRVGGTAEVVREGEAGLLFAPLDVEELKLRIEAILSDPSRLGAWGAKARAVALAYSIDHVAESYEALYRES